MFEHFTDRARRVLVLAQEESRLLRHDTIAPEHILMGLIGESDGVAALVLGSFDISVATARHRLVATVGGGDVADPGAPQFTPAAKRLLEQSLRESLQLGVRYIGTEHMLLAIVDENDGVAIDVLAALGAERERVRRAVLKMIEGVGPAPAAREHTAVALLADLLRHIDAGEVVPTDATLDPANLLTPEDLAEIWRQQPLDPIVTTAVRQVDGVEHRWASFVGPRLPSATLAVAAADVTVDVFDRYSRALGPTMTRPVEGLGSRASFDTQSNALRVLSGSTLFVITVTGAQERSLDIATTLARKVLARIQA